MPKTVHCHDHGECQETFVCSHLTSADSAGLGFHRAEPTDEDPFPDAWCDECEIIFQAHDGWNDESQKLVAIRLICCACYELSRIRNTRTDVSFEDLVSLRWKCSSCEEWHTGPCLDFSFASPVYWRPEDDEGNQINFFKSGRKGLPTTFLNEDICVIDGEHYFVRGVLHLPIVGSTQTFRWGVWGSLSREHFEQLLQVMDDPSPPKLPPMFSWLSSYIDDYPETRNLKMYAHIQEPGARPIFELEPTDHPLSQEYHHGITAERVREIMARRLDFPVM